MTDVAPLAAVGAASVRHPGTAARRPTPRYSFSGHQTFPFRYAWLPKGVQAVGEDSGVFGSPDALVRLGVGRNMVASIRHWGEALSLFETRRGQSTLLPLGSFLFGGASDAVGASTGSLTATPPPPPPRNPKKTRSIESETNRKLRSQLPIPLTSDRFENGGGSTAADPCLEDPGTLWLLHWQLTSRPGPASTWHLVFTRYAESAFTRDELAAWLLRCAHDSGNRRPSPASIRRDLDVFIRTYLPARTHARRPLEDTFDCPLAELGLLRNVGAGRFELRRGARPSLPVHVLLFATLEFWQRESPDQRTLPIERLLFDPGSPGAAFRLGDRDLVDMVERLPGRWGVRYDETAGMRLLLRERESDPFDVLRDYYFGASAA